MFFIRFAIFIMFSFIVKGQTQQIDSLKSVHAYIGIGQSDMGFERASLKAKREFLEAISQGWKKGDIVDSLYFNFLETQHQFHFTEIDTIQKNPILVEYFYVITPTFKMLIPGIKTEAITDKKPPFWDDVNLYGSNKASYLGFGRASNKLEADRIAFQEFAKHVETKVKSVFETTQFEHDETFTESSKSLESVITDISLKGISVTERYVDTTSVPSIFYSLVAYDKNEYNHLVIEEKKREFDKEIALIKEQKRLKENEMALKKLKDKEQEDELAYKENERKRLKREEAYRLEKYKVFLTEPANSRVVSFHNAELNSSLLTSSVKLNFDPFKVYELYQSVRLWVFELSGQSRLIEDHFSFIESGAKVQILSNKGYFNKLSLALGYVLYQPEEQSKLDGIPVERSFSISGNIMFPKAGFSHLSVYWDHRFIKLGWNSYLFHQSFGNSFGIVLETNVITDQRYRTPFDENVVFQGGIFFKNGDSFKTYVTFEEHHMLTLRFDIGLF